jgi:hypothetical protein
MTFNNTEIYFKQYIMQPNPNELSWFEFLYKNKVQDDYASDLGWTVGMIFAFCCAKAYLKIRSNVHLIRNNWITYRCNPAYMPFAGMIMKPTGTFNEKVTFSNENFEYCIQTELKSISGMFMEPLYYTQSVAISTLQGMANALNAIRELINNIRDAVSSIVGDIMGRVLNVMQPVVGLMLNARDMTGKIQGIMTTSLYTVLGMYDTIQSGLKSIFEIIVIILIAMGAAIVLLWLIPFVGTAAAIAMTAIFIAIAIPMGIIAHFLAETMHIHGLSLVP